MRERIFFHLVVLTSFFLSLVLQSCKDDGDITVQTPPKVTTAEVVDVSPGSATAGGEVTDDGGAKVTARGVCWSTSNNPTLEDSFTEDGEGEGTFTSTLNDLTPETKYYVRAYATNKVGTTYGEEVVFTTGTPTLPVVKTIGTADLHKNSVRCFGQILSDGGGQITALGICFSVNPGPTVSENVTSETPDTGTFSSALTELTPETKYYMRAYATNSAGTAYGDEISITTHPFDMYVIGYVHFNGDQKMALYLKNNNPFALSMPTGGLSSIGNDLAVRGSDVHVAGYITKATHSAAVYWKNQDWVQLTEDGHYAEAKAIAMDNDNIYIAGHNNYKAVYWKNGIEVPLSTTSSGATDIAVVNGDIYIAGYELDENTSKFVAKYWKNGTPVNLTNGSNSAYAITIAINGNDVYVAGEEYIPQAVARYWKNGVAMDITATDPRIGAMAVKNNHVHVVGADYGSGLAARYWLDGSSIPLDNATGIFAHDIAFFNNDVYIVGSKESATSLIIWKNQEILTEFPSAAANAIFFD